MSKKMSEVLPPDEILAQLAEECSEFSQASLKLRRAMNGVNPTPKTVPECWENFIEEYADVVEMKQARWLSRLESKEQSNE